MSVPFMLEHQATSARAGFDELYRAYEEEWGSNSYNGTISTTDFYGVTKKVAEVSSDKAFEIAVDFVENNEHGSKGCCYAVDCGIDHWVSKTLKRRQRSSNAEPPKYELRYVVGDDIGRMLLPGAYKTVTEAKEALSKAFLSGEIKAGSSYTIVKQPVLVKGRSTVAEFDVVEKTTKSKPKKAKKGSLVQAVRSCLYYGTAWD